jgi:hypothetical protein
MLLAIKKINNIPGKIQKKLCLYLNRVPNWERSSYFGVNQPKCLVDRNRRRMGCLTQHIDCYISIYSIRFCTRSYFFGTWIETYHYKANVWMVNEFNTIIAKPDFPFPPVLRLIIRDLQNDRSYNIMRDLLNLWLWKQTQHNRKYY